MTKPDNTRTTLDGQLVGYWDREAARFDKLAAEARWAWVKRGYARKAARARARAEPSRVREAARQRGASGDVSSG